MAKKVIKTALTKETRPEPVWGGPEKEGISQSLINRWLRCPERFRIYSIEGLCQEEEFSHKIEYGNMWHECEEAFCNNQPWRPKLLAYTRKLLSQYSTKADEINKWFKICETQFPIYAEYWSGDPDVCRKKPVFQEERFKVHYRLPSGREVILRGKWDAVDTISKEIWLQENKCKGDIAEERMIQELTFDLQTMLYLIALKAAQESGEYQMPNLRVAGIRYNVIRRPLSDWQGSFNIRQRSGREVWNKTKTAKIRVDVETDKEFYERLGTLIKDNAGHFFMRWKISINPGDIAVFDETMLQPVLENICDDYEWWRYCKLEDISPFDYQERAILFPEHRTRHYRVPYGLYSPIFEGRGKAEFHDYLMKGSTAGIVNVTSLFPELD